MPLLWWTAADTTTPAPASRPTSTADPTHSTGPDRIDVDQYTHKTATRQRWQWSVSMPRRWPHGMSTVDQGRARGFVVSTRATPRRLPQDGRSTADRRPAR